MPKNGSGRVRAFNKKVKEIVREEMKEESEDKVAVTGGTNILIDTSAIPNGAVGSSTNFVKILPLIEQGIGQYNQRIGNEIRLKNLDIKMLFNYDQEDIGNLYNASVGVRVMILRQKDQNSQLGIVSDFQGNKLMENGAILSPGPAPFAGLTFNLLQKINREQFSVRYDKVIYLDAPLRGSGATRVLPARPKTMSHTLKFGKQGLKLTFGDAASDNPTNFPYIIVMGVASCIGSTVPVGRTISYSYTANAHYTDS